MAMWLFEDTGQAALVVFAGTKWARVVHEDSPGNLWTPPSEAMGGYSAGGRIRTPATS